MDEEGTVGRYGWWMRREQQERKVWWMRRGQQEGMAGGRGRYSRKGRLVDEEGTVRREGWWMRKVH